MLPEFHVCAVTKWSRTVKLLCKKTCRLALVLPKNLRYLGPARPLEYPAKILLDQSCNDQHGKRWHAAELDGGKQFSLLLRRYAHAPSAIHMSPKIDIMQYTPTVGFEVAYLCCLFTNMLERVCCAQLQCSLYSIGTTVVAMHMPRL